MRRIDLKGSATGLSDLSQAEADAQLDTHRGQRNARSDASSVELQRLSFTLRSCPRTNLCGRNTLINFLRRMIHTSAPLKNTETALLEKK
jgi:hypothetical protein